MKLYWATPWLACYDGDGTGQGGEGNGGEGGDEGQSTSFTQDEVNSFLAQERRKMEGKLKAMEQSVSTALENQSLSQEERDRLEKSLEEVKAMSRTKEQQFLHEKKVLEDQLKAEKEQVSRTWGMFENTTIERHLLDAAASNEAYNAHQLVKLLRTRSKLIENKDEKGKPLGTYEVMVELDDLDAESGDPIVTTRSPDAAVKRMKELPELYGNLFKNGVVSGLGGSSATGGVQPGKNGRLSRDQIKNLSHDQYAKIRKEQPELLGFSK